MKSKVSALISLAGLLIFSLSFTPALPVKAASSISVGQYVELGNYYGEPILWRCVDIDEHGALMLSDRILTSKAFDAAGEHPNDRNDNRLSGGSNLWETSNIRAWLNSTASAGNVEWPCDNPPIGDLASSGASSRRWRPGGQYNAYASEKGFLADGNFTANERAVIKTVTQKSLLTNVDIALATSGSTTYYHHHDVSYKISVPVQDYDIAYAHNVTDKIFLLDLKQIYRVYQNLGDYYMGRPTEKAVANSDYQNSTYFADTHTWHYWLRSPFPGSRYPQNVRYVTSMGYLFHVKASSSYLGIRPAFYIDLSSLTFKSGNGSAGNPYTIGHVQKEPDVVIFIDKRPLHTDVPPLVLHGRTMVPLRAIFEALAINVEWFPDSGTIIGTRGDTRIELAVDSTRTLVNGTAGVLDVPATIIEGRTMVPVRFIAESTGQDVVWEATTRTVNITTK